MKPCGHSAAYYKGHNIRCALCDLQRAEQRLVESERRNAVLSRVIDKKDFRDVPENDLPRKNTWLLYKGPKPPDVDWSGPKGTHLTSFLKRTTRVAPRLSKKEAIKTPPAFRDMLIGLARHSQSAKRL